LSPSKREESTWRKALHRQSFLPGWVDDPKGKRNDREGTGGTGGKSPTKKGENLQVGEELQVGHF